MENVRRNVRLRSSARDRRLGQGKTAGFSPVVVNADEKNKSSIRAGGDSDSLSAVRAAERKKRIFQTDALF